MKQSDFVKRFFIVVLCPCDIFPGRIFFELRKYTNHLSVIVHKLSLEDNEELDLTIECDSLDYNGFQKEINPLEEVSILPSRTIFMYWGIESLIGIYINEIDKNVIRSVYSQDAIEVFETYEEGDLFYEFR